MVRRFLISFSYSTYLFLLRYLLVMSETMLTAALRLSAKDKIAVCGGPADAVLRVMHIPTGECLSLIENCASPVMRYASGVFFHSTAGMLMLHDCVSLSLSVFYG